MDKKSSGEKTAEIRRAEILEDARRQHIPVMMDSGMAFLLEFVKEHTEIRDILECGTAVGYSAIQMALVRWDMRVDTLEIDADMVEEARRNIEAQGLSKRITVWHTDAARFETEQIYDLIFIDAAKSQYRRYLEHFMRNSRPGTWFVFDNLNFHGIVDHPELSSNRSTIQMTHNILKFRNHLLSDDRFETVFYPDTGDGIAVSRRIV